MRKRSIERAFWKTTQSTASLTGNKFYGPLASSLSDALSVEHVILSKRLGANSNYIRSLACVQFKDQVDNIEYDVENTPCERVLKGNEFSVERGLRKKFPKDDGLILLNAEAYAGVPLRSLNDEIIGNLCVLNCKPLPEAKEILPVLRVFAARAAAELERQETELRLKTIVSSMDDAFCLYTVNFKKALYVNPGFEKIWGHPPKMLYRKPHLWLDAVIPEDRPRVQRAFSGSGEKLNLDIEYRIRRADGEIRVVRNRAFRVEDKNDPVPKFCSVAEDVTERRAEAKELEHSRKFGALGQMAASVTHDFKTILTVFRASIGMLEDEPSPSPTLRRITDMLTVSCDRGMSLASQLLSFTRNEESPLGPLDLNQIIEQTTELLGRLMQGEVVFQMRLEKGAPKILADRCQMEQLLTNLILNARDSMPQGGTVTIRTHRSAFAEHPPRPALLLSVTDTGVGMDSLTLSRAMDPFFSTKEKEKGTGIGMTTVQNIAARHSAGLRIESSSGKGTQVSVLLPLAPPSAGA